MTLGNFGEKYELVAMKAAGVSLWRVLRPLIVVSLLLSLMAFFFSNNVIPTANKKLKTIMYEVKTKKPTLNIKPSQFYSEIENYTIRIGSKDKEGKNMKDIIVYDHTKDLGNISVTIADSGQMYSVDNGNTLVFRLFSGYTFDENIEGENISSRPLMRLNFQEQTIRFDVSDFAFQEAEEDRYDGHYKMLDIEALNRNLDTLHKNENQIIEIVSRLAKENFSINVKQDVSKDNFYSKLASLSLERKQDIENITTNKVEFLYNEINANLLRLVSEQDMIRRHEIEKYKRYTLAFACFIFLFIGAPLGAIIRKGGMGMPVVISTVLFIVYYIIDNSGYKMAREGIWEVWQGMWLSAFILLPFGILLTYMAATESSIMNGESYIMVFKKFFSKENIIFAKINKLKTKKQ
jgi:lipopolysaccharide export system permease protein